MRQIVASLTGDTEGCSELASELSRADPVTLETQDSEDEGSDPEEWTPDPTDALTGHSPAFTHSTFAYKSLVFLMGVVYTLLIHLEYS